MEPPPPPPAPPLTTAAPATTAAAVTPHMTSYPDSIDSSPRSRNTDSWDDPPALAASVLSSKLRLMCSYGGHIVPRPHDKSLCYVGGDTRIVVVDRNTSLSSLSSRLSNTLLDGRSFTLKYQLPSEDLDSLISVTTDEDLDNMIDEYDRTTSTSNSSNKPSRLRLFLFPLKPESSQSIGPILETTTKGDDWFLNALNGSGLLNRGFSDSTSVNCLLGLDDDVGSGGGGSCGGNLDLGARDVEGQQKNAKHQQQGGQDVHSVPDSPMLETASSFGSTSSSPSLANLPPIRVHVDDGVGGGGGGGGGVRVQDQKIGIEEQFAQMSVGGMQKQQDEGFVVLSSPPPMPTTIAVSGVPVSAGTAPGEFLNRAYSDDERSDHGLSVGYRKPPTPQSQPQTVPQVQQKSSGGHELPSPDSVSSDSSITNAMSRQKPVLYQDPLVQIPSGASRIVGNPVDPKINVSDPNTRLQIQDSGYLFQPQYDQQQQQQQPQPQPQQQFIHTGAHYIHHHPTGPVPIPYYPVYPSQQHSHPHHHPQLDQQQYSVYYMPTRQPQAYSLPVQQSSISEAATAIPSSRPQTPPPPNPSMVSSPAAFNPIRNAPIAKSEMGAAGMYRTTAAGAPQLVQVPPSQHQQQYVGYSQIHHPSQSVGPTSAGSANYAYEFADPSHAHIYYTQPLAPTMPSQYQTMTSAGMVLPEGSAQLPAENMKQQIRTSQQ